MSTRIARCGVAGLAVLAICASHAAAVCVDWKASGRYADAEAAEVVFEGVVTRVEVDSTTDCAPDRVHLKVTRVWKGPNVAEHIILQDTARMTSVSLPDGSSTPSTCPIWVEGSTLEQDKAYIVFASTGDGGLRAFPCSHSEAPTKATRDRLNKWMKRKGRGR
jgi:hypothetical protein